MPTTLVGLLIFVGLITPGFVHHLVAERGLRPGRNVSVFRETASITVASIVAWIVTLSVFGLARLIFPAQTPKVRRLLREPGRYFVESHTSLTVWLVAALIFSSFLAYVWASTAAGPRLSRRLSSSKRLRWLGPPNDISFVSAWWVALKVNEPERRRLVHCRLSDGSEVQGWLSSFNSSSDETADRDLLLDAPIYYWRPETEGAEIQDYGSVVVSARTIVFLRVEYWKPSDVNETTTASLATTNPAAAPPPTKPRRFPPWRR